MALDLTTISRVKERRGISSATHDSLLSNLIDEVSTYVETYLGRHTLQDARVEVYEVEFLTRMVSVRGAPITVLNSIKISNRRDDFDDVTAMATTSYSADLTAGYIRLDFEQSHNPGYVQVDYTGGMATDTDDFVMTYPDIAGAVDAEVINRFNRRENPTGDSQTRGGRFDHESPLDLMPFTRRALYAYRRGVLGGLAY